MSTHVKSLVVDEWHGVFCKDEPIAAPTLADIEQALEKLDSHTRTLIFLHGNDERFLAVGGKRGHHIVYASTPDGQLFNLINGDADDDTTLIAISIGGQEGEFPARQVMPAQTALQAVRYFSETGEQDPSLRWEPQD